MHRIFILLAFLLLPMPAWAWEARVVAIADGDTLTVEPASGGERLKIRLHGIDAPEKNQPGGEPARAFVFKVALYKTVDVQPTSQRRERYGRTVAVLILPSGESLQAMLIREGHAWVWPRYCTNCREWESLQEDARRNRRGLWSSPAPIPPWEWRRTQKAR